MATKEVSIKKRQLISQASHNVFVAVSCASVVVGFCAVGSYFLVHEMFFRAKVIGEKNTTRDILGSDTAGNIKSVSDLNIGLKTMIETNELLKRLTEGKIYDTSRKSVISDALPLVSNDGRLNTLAARMSISKLISMVPGVSLDRLSISAATPSSIVAGNEGVLYPVLVDLSITGSSLSVQAAIKNLERSIRQIDLQDMKWSRASEKLTLSTKLKVYFTTSIKLSLTEKEVKSSDSSSSKTTTTGGSK